MSRLDNFDEILNSYEGREYKKLSIEDVRKVLSEGFEDKCRFGLLVGKIDEKKIIEGAIEKIEGNIFVKEVVVPEQDSDMLKTIVSNWAPAMDYARSQGDIIGMALYVGKGMPAVISAATCNTHELLSKNWGIGGLIVALNEIDCCIKNQQIK